MEENKMIKPKYIDLHTHTFYSDGIGTPELNVKLARLSALDVIAITDHDKIEGYAEAKATGDKWQIQVIPGVEISTDKYHILGLGINIKQKSFNEFLNYSANEQKKVCIKRINFFREMGCPITLEKVVNAFPYSRLGKFNVLMTLDQDKECQEFFMKKYNQILTKEFYDTLMESKSAKGVVDKMTAITPQEAIKQVHAAGGIAIIAHPFKEIKDLVELDELVKQGLDGLEVQPTFNGRNKETYEYALKHKLLVTYGSDYHGGLFGRPILNNGYNIASKELAEALRIK
jgi:predicted metal-dependent phosphoesterase TrpH